MESIDGDGVDLVDVHHRALKSPVLQLTLRLLERLSPRVLELVVTELPPLIRSLSVLGLGLERVVLQFMTDVTHLLQVNAGEELFRSVARWWLTVVVVFGSCNSRLLCLSDYLWLRFYLLLILRNYLLFFIFLMFLLLLQLLFLLLDLFLVLLPRR